MSDVSDQRRYYERMLDEIATEHRQQIDHLKSENAKLLELLRAAWKCVHAGLSCSDCRLIAGGCTLQTAMDELGVEVE